MGYLLAFGVILVGYTLLDWGHYVQRHEQVNLWYLISGQGERSGKGGDKTSTASGASGLSGSGAVAGGGNPESGGGSW